MKRDLQHQILLRLLFYTAIRVSELTNILVGDCRRWRHGGGERTKMCRAGLYARVSTNDQQTLAMQNRAMREYAALQDWEIAMQVREVNSGVEQRQARRKPARPVRLSCCQQRSALEVGCF
jgi:hypothetical protein